MAWLDLQTSLPIDASYFSSKNLSPFRICIYRKRHTEASILSPRLTRPLVGAPLMRFARFAHVKKNILERYLQAHYDSEQLEKRTKIFHCPKSSEANERASERTNKDSGARERSEASSVEQAIE